jgi:sodium pump decarboxylase gamma subunit
MKETLFKNFTLDNLYFALGVSVTSMIIVFGVLLVLMLIIKLQSFLLGRDYKKNQKANEKPKKVTVAVNEADNTLKTVDVNKEYELVAAIMATLSAHTGKSLDELNIKSIKRVNNNSSWRSTSIK